jgi:hypothetical protein
MIKALWSLRKIDGAAVATRRVPGRSDQESEAAVQQLLGQLAQINGLMLSLATRS